MSTAPKNYVTPEQYFELDARSERRSEYYHGEMFALAGTSSDHNLICFNIARRISDQLRPGCWQYLLDLRVQVSPDRVYTYPDVVVTCDPKFLNAKRHTLLNPIAIVEVQSPSTEAYDRIGKFNHYRTIESLREYLLVASEYVGVEVRRMNEAGEWVTETADRPEATIELRSINCRLTLAEIYQNIEFAEPPKEEG